MRTTYNDTSTQPTPRRQRRGALCLVLRGQRQLGALRAPTLVLTLQTLQSMFAP